MAVKFSNNATTTLSTNVSAGATSFSVDSASTFPTLGTGDWCYITLSGSETEVVKVTDIDGTTFTCEALANSYSSGDAVGLRVSAETLDDVYSWADKISVDGTGVDVTGTVTADGLVSSGATTITSGTADGLTINHDTFAKGLILHRNHASNSASIVFKNNSGLGGVLYGSNSDGHLYYRMGAAQVDNKLWHAGNDGSGSGLDADTVDGIQASSFVRSDANDTKTGRLDFGAAMPSLTDTSNTQIYQYATNPYTTKNSGNANTWQQEIHYRNNVNTWRMGTYDEDNSGGAGKSIYRIGGKNRSGNSEINYLVCGPQGDGWTDRTVLYNPYVGTSGDWDGSGTHYKIWHAGNDGSGSGLDADTIDGFGSARFKRRLYRNNATVGPGWMSVAKNTSGRKHGEVIVTDGDSSDHAFIRIEWMRSYADSNFTVLNCGGHSNRITGVRVISEDSDDTYGEKILQVYVGTSSNYEVNIYAEDITDYGEHSAFTPVIEDSKSGYSVHGSSLTSLNTYGFAHEEGIRAGGNIRADYDVHVGNSLYVPAKIIHTGDTDTYTEFHAANRWRVVTGGSERIEVDGSEFKVNATTTFSQAAVPFKFIESDKSDGYTGKYWRMPLDGGNLRFDICDDGDGLFTPYTTPLQMDSDGTLTSNGNTVWHAGNDGSGSGLDADTLDGSHASSFEPANNTIVRKHSSISTHNWNDYINGDNASYRSVVGASGSNKPPNYNYGVAVNFSINTQAKFQLYASHTGSAGNGLRYRTGWNTDYKSWAEIWDSNNDGSGSGLDADLLDGKHASEFVEHMDGSRTNGANLNSYTTSGFYNVGAATISNKPSGASDYSQLIVAKGTDTGIQLYGGYNNPTLYVRGWHQSGTFFTWRKLWSDSNDGSGSGLDADTVDGLQASQFLRSDAFDTSSSGLYLQGGSYSAGTDTATAPLIIDHGDYIHTKDNTYLRRLIGKSSNVIYIGQGGTALINKIDLIPGNSGNSAVKVNNNTVWNAGNDGSGSGLDADLLDGINSTGFVKQIGDGSSPNYTTPSSRRINPNTSNPTNEHYAVSTFGNDGNVTGQLATHFISGQAYTRGYNSSWSSWRKQWDNNNDGSGSGLDADLLDGQQGSYYAPSSHNHAYITATNDNVGDTRLQYINTSNNTTLNPSTDWYTTIRMGHGNPTTYYANTLAVKMTGSNVGEIYTRTLNNGTNQSWRRQWDSLNDGSGSGLDADLLDGQQGSYYYSPANPPPAPTVSGTLGPIQYSAWDVAFTTYSDNDTDGGQESGTSIQDDDTTWGWSSTYENLNVGGGRYGSKNLSQLGISNPQNAIVVGYGRKVTRYHYSDLYRDEADRRTMYRVIS